MMKKSKLYQTSLASRLKLVCQKLQFEAITEVVLKFQINKVQNIYQLHSEENKVLQDENRQIS